MSASKILFFLCISFVVGIFLESLLKIPQIFVWGILILGVIFIFLFTLSFPRKRESSEQKSGFPIKLGMTGIIGFCVLFLILGILRVQISEYNIANDKLSKLNDKGEVILTGTINDEPDVRDTYQKLKIKVGQSIILATINRYPEYKYLDQIKITGKLETPSVTDEFNYKNYLLKDGIYSVINFPKVEILSKEHKYNTYSYFYEKILFLKQSLRQSIKQNFTPPASLILQGTIVGDNGALSKELKDKLNITGLRHIIAVSGTHIIILSGILISVLLFLGFWRKQAIVLSIIIVWLYIILTGLSASGIRAGVMGSVLFLSQIFSRQNTSQRTMALAGSLMLLQNPLLLMYDAGFQLSFLASMGIIYLNPILKRFLKSEILSTTFSAQIFTMPLMVFNFGNISLVAPITNLLVLPIVSPLMIFGFISAFFGIFSSFLGFILSLPCQILLIYFVKVIDLFSKPYMAIFFNNISWIWLLILYLLIAVLTRYLRKKYINIFV